MSEIYPVQEVPVSPLLSPMCENCEDNEEQNFLLRVQDLVLRIFELLGKMSEKDRAHVDTLKREFREASLEMASLQTRIGNAAPWISGVAFAISVTQIFASQDISPVIRFGAEQIPNVGSVYTSHLQADQTGFQAISSLRQTEISAQTQKGQSEAEVRNAILGLLNSMLEGLKKASS